MKSKKYRNLKVYLQGGAGSKEAPTILLKGQWVEKCGFHPGMPITVKCENGRLTVMTEAEYNLDTIADQPAKMIAEDRTY